MSRTFRTVTVMLAALSLLGLSGCSEDEQPTAKEQATSVSPTPSSVQAPTQQASKTPVASLHAESRRLHVAIKHANGRTKKLFAVINLACRHEFPYSTATSKDQKGHPSQSLVDAEPYYQLYSDAYQKFWYPSQAVAFPYDLEGAMLNHCPRSFVPVGAGGMIGG